MQEVRPPNSWGEWLGFTKESKTLTQKLGLLHGAFDFEMGREEWDSDKKEYKAYTTADRLETFFGIADGWADKSLLRTKGIPWGEEPKYYVGRDKYGNSIERTESEQRQVLARKAFDMLVVHFFRMPEVREDSYDRTNEENRWISRFVFGPLFPVVQNFFCIRMDGSRNKVRNLSWRSEQRPQSEKQAVNFLLKLPKFLWEWKEPSVSYWGKSPEDKARQKKEEENILAMRAIVDGAKPWMIEILAELHELRLIGEWIRELDEPCLATLKEIALQNELAHHRRHPVTEDRKVATIDEACYTGSPAGWLLKKYELMTREHKRLTAIQEAEWARDKAAREVEELTRQK